jgi:hypothetical protein
MARICLIAGIIVLACAPSARALAGASAGWDSTSVITIPADSAMIASPADSAAVISTPPDSITVATPSVSEPAAPVGSLPTRADSIAFQGVTRRVKPHATARVASPADTVIVHGRDMSLQGVQHYGHPDSTLAWADVKKVQYRGSASDRGAITGAVVFSALGMLAVASDDPNQSGTSVIAGTVGAAALGALLGAVVAAPFHRWKDVDLDSPHGGGLFNDARRGFTFELGAGPGFTNESNGFSETDAGTEFAGLTRFRLGYGFSERHAIAYVNDVAWNGNSTGITGLGLSLFSAPGSPSWALELTAGLASSGDVGDERSNHFGIQGGLGLEFSRHWIARGSVMYFSAGEENHTVLGTSISRFWY